MKVIVLTPNYPRRDAQMNGIFIHQQLKALAQLGVECHVILSYQWFPPLGGHKLHAYWTTGFYRFHSLFEEFEDITIHRVPVFVKMPQRFFPENPLEREAKAIANYIVKNEALNDANCIYGNFLTDSAYTAILIKSLIGKKVISIARGDDVHAWPEENPTLIPVIQKVFKDSDVILANSHRLAMDANSWVNEDEKREVGVVYNGVDLEKFSPASDEEKIKFKNQFFPSSQRKTLLCVATPVEIKGWLVLLDAIAEAKEYFEDWELVAVAVNRLNSDALDLKEEAEKRGIKNSVRIMGQLEHHELANLYKSVDAFVLPSFNEGMANVVLEAAASNLPLLITDVGGHQEVFNSSKTAVIVPPRNVEALKNGLLQLISNVIHNPSDTRQVVSEKVGTYLDNAKKLKKHFESN